MNKEQILLDDENLENVSGGDLGSWQIIALGMLVLDAKQKGKTKEEFIGELKAKYENKNSDYYELLGYAYSMWDEIEA